MLSDRSPRITEALPEIDAACDVVLVVDPWTTPTHAHGPFDGIPATVAADRLRTRLDAARRPDVAVTLSRVRRPEALAEYLCTPPRARGGGH